MVKKKNIEYRIILTLDEKQKKILFKSKDRDTSLKEYNRLMVENNKNIVIPKVFNNNKGINKCKHELLLLKEIGPDAIVLPIKRFNNYKIILKDEFLIEETFMVYGYNSRTERKTIHEIVKILTEQNTNSFRDVIVVHNKIVIYNDDFFDMIICKCELDARRLNSVLFELFNKNKKHKFIFLGLAKLENMTFLYDLIQEETQWSRGRIRRTTTRP